MSLPVVVVVAEEQRADAVHAGVAGAGKGVAADDEFLLVEALALEPVGAAAGGVFGGGALGDDAFGVQLAGVVEDGGAVGFEVFGEAEDVGVGAERGVRRGVPCAREREVAGVVAVEVEEVEGRSR